MAQYTVSVKIHEKWVDTFNTSKTSLCMAKVVQDSSGGMIYNVIAQTKSSVQKTMHISWQDDYSILGSEISFEAGTKIAGLSDPEPIPFGYTYELTSWTKHNVYKDEKLKANSIGFKNHVACSTVLSMKVGSKYVPVYISPTIRPPGQTTLTPQPQVMLWFQDHAESATMIADFSTAPWPVNLVPNGEVWAQFTEEGKFAPYTPSSS